MLLADDVNPSGSTGTATRGLTFDHLVLSLGSLPTYFGMQNVEAQAYPFKTLLDAIGIRNRVIDIFERADREPDLALVDWVIDLFFPRDIVQTIDLTPQVAPTEWESRTSPTAAGSGR